MSLTTSSVTPLINQIPLNPNFPEYVTIINPDGSVTYETNLHYQQPTIIRRSYAKRRKARQYYALEQVYFHDSDYFLFYILFNRKENHIVVVNGVDIVGLVIVQHLIFAIEF